MPLPATDGTLPTVPRDADRLFALAEQWNLVSPCRRLVDALAG